MDVLESLRVFVTPCPFTTDCKHEPLDIHFHADMGKVSVRKQSGENNGEDDKKTETDHPHS